MNRCLLTLDASMALDTVILSLCASIKLNEQVRTCMPDTNEHHDELMPAVTTTSRTYLVNAPYNMCLPSWLAVELLPPWDGHLQCRL